MRTTNIPRPSFTGARYPVDAKRYAPIGEDLELCNQRLSDVSSSLFQIAADGTQVFWTSRHDEGRMSSLSQGPNTQHYVLSNEVMEGENLDKV
jgi:hypothetical protein